MACAVPPWCVCGAERSAYAVTHTPSQFLVPAGEKKKGPYELAAHRTLVERTLKSSTSSLFLSYRDVKRGCVPALDDLWPVFQAAKAPAHRGLIGKFIMNKVQDLLRLVLTTSLSDRDIGRRISMSKNTVRRHRLLCREQGYTWEALKELPLDELARRFNKKFAAPPQKRLPNFAYIHAELARTGVTLQLLWEEYRSTDPEDALSYSQFTYHYRQHQASLRLSMRQTHRPGEKAFVDFSGKRPHYIDPQTGEHVAVELFVGILGHSSLSFALATRTQNVGDWIEAHVQMLEYFGGAPVAVVPDNLKSAVIRPGAEPVLNRDYLEFARYHDLAILPARVRRPKDKAAVEGCVRIVQRWILARLRNQQFASLEALNAEIRRLCEQLNQRTMKLWGCSRRERFEANERALLTPLPAQRYEMACWSAAQTVPPDYHVRGPDNWYSVSHLLIGKLVEIRATHKVVEVFHQGERITSHARNPDGGPCTKPEHQPPQHRAYAQRNPESLMAWAQAIGPSLERVVRAQLERKVPALGLPACDGLRRLAQRYGNQALEQACTRALEIQSLTLKSVKSLLSTGRYKAAHPEAYAQTELPLHHNVRGASYYQHSADGEVTC